MGPRIATGLTIRTFFWDALSLTSALSIGLAIGFANAVIGRFDKRVAEQASNFSLLESKLRLIRAYVQNALSFYEKEGPWGGSGGSSWTDGTFSSIESITVICGSLIDAIQVNYRLNGTDDIRAHWHGNNGGQEATIKFARDEYLTQIEGYYGKYGDEMEIKSLTFKTNRGDYGPYGSPYKDGYYFRSIGRGMIVGFHGSAGYYLMAAFIIYVVIGEKSGLEDQA